jgi:molybdopterin molybdotransferase
MDAGGLILAGAVRSRWDLPRCDTAAMDGFALGAADRPAKRLKIVGRAFAGEPFPHAVKRGEAIEITTGAVLPAGTDTVVPVENTGRQGDHVELPMDVRPGRHVRRRGEEYRCGDTLLSAGTRLNAGEIGLLASAGIDQVEAIPRPQVALFATGDELVELGQVPAPGQLVNSNLLYLVTRLREWGYEVDSLGIAKDREPDLERLVARSRKADLLLTSGGVSGSARDLVQESLLHAGLQRKFRKVAIRPGRSLLFGTLAGRPCFGLPGAPAAMAATLELFVRPALILLEGSLDVRPLKRTALLVNDLPARGKQQAFHWCRCRWENGRYRVRIAERRKTGQLRSIQMANALLPMPTDGTDLRAGQRVEVLLIRSLEC